MYIYRKTSGGLPNPGIKPKSLLSPGLAGGFFTSARPGKLLNWVKSSKKAEYSLLGQLVPLHHIEPATREEEDGKGRAHSNVNISQNFPKLSVHISVKREKL